MIRVTHADDDRREGDRACRGLADALESPLAAVGRLTDRPTHTRRLERSTPLTSITAGGWPIRIAGWRISRLPRSWSGLQRNAAPRCRFCAPTTYDLGWCDGSMHLAPGGPPSSPSRMARPSRSSTPRQGPWSGAASHLDESGRCTDDRSRGRVSPDRVGRRQLVPVDAPRRPETARRLFAYSPQHHVKSGTCYPATLVTTALNDDRAPAWLHESQTRFGGAVVSSPRRPAGRSHWRTRRCLRLRCCRRPGICRKRIGHAAPVVSAGRPLARHGEDVRRVMTDRRSPRGRTGCRCEANAWPCTYPPLKSRR